MDDARADLVGRLLRILVLAFALWVVVVIEALDLRGPDPEVPRHVVDNPTEHAPGPRGCAPFC